MLRTCLPLALGLSVVFASANLAAADQDSETISIVQVDEMPWMDYPGLPGVKYVVLAGNPSQPGVYVIRAKFAPHTMSRPHWHPEARYVTVLKGTWWAGTGESFDPDSTTPIHAGGFAIHTPGKVHYDGAKDEEAIVQITGMGPSATNVINRANPAKQ
jgi:quercetin dioxygenase-like cupin family protein